MELKTPAQKKAVLKIARSADSLELLIYLAANVNAHNSTTEGRVLGQALLGLLVGGGMSISDARPLADDMALELPVSLYWGNSSDRAHWFKATLGL